jgi:hypothetical protein
VELAMPQTAIYGTSVCQLHIVGNFTLEFYKHICTRRYLLLDSEGRCYQRGQNGLKPADVHAELKRVTE